MERIKKFSTGLRAVITVVYVLANVGLVVLIILLAILGFMQLSGGSLPIATISVFGVSTKISELGWGFWVMIVPALARFLIMLAGLKGLRRLLTQYIEGEVFSDESVSLTSRIGKLAVAYGVVPIIEVTRGADSLSFQLSPEMGVVIMGAFIILVAWVTDEGRKMREEQELVV